MSKTFTASAAITSVDVCGLFNNATQVVMMREGTRTVLSMQNNYEGPPSNFAMVVPVPVILQKENVKTLPKELFARIDQLDAMGAQSRQRAAFIQPHEPAIANHVGRKNRRKSTIEFQSRRSVHAYLAQANRGIVACLGIGDRRHQ